MADKWMDERDRQMRDRDWRRSEQYGRGADDSRGGRPGEGRSFGTDQTGYRGQDRVFGERETGSNYSRGTGATPGSGAYGGGQSYGRGAGGGRPGGQSYGGGFSGGGDDRPAWQDRDYGGASPAFESQDYTQGGGEHRGGGDRYERGAGQYGDDVRSYGPAPRSYDSQRQGSSAYGRPYGQSGGTGGYDYERGYGDAGRRGDSDRTERTERFEDAGRGAGQFLHRAGEKVASWFSSNDQSDDRRYREDFGRERRDMGHRGLGPKGYKRPDERINEEAHDRLTDDAWLDASNINISVSGGEVTLSGTVENREAKHRAERLVEDLPGVNHVQNNLRIAKGSFLTSPTSGFGDSVVEAQMRQDDPTSNGTGGAGSGQSTAGRKS